MGSVPTGVFPSQPPPMAGVVHIDVRVRFDRWHVATAGDPEAPPVVLLHGWPQHWWAWRKIIPALAQEHRVYAPDLRGFGWSDAPVGRYSKMGLACDIELLLDVLELETCTLVGHDWGGFTAWLTAIRAPERLDRLVVFSIHNPWRLPQRTPQLIATALGYQLPVSSPILRTRIQPRVVRTVLKLGVGREHRWAEEELRLYSDQFRRPAHAAAASAVYRTFLTREAAAIGRGRYAKRRVQDIPVTVAAGSADGFTGPNTWPGLEQHVTTLSKHVIDGAGHFVPEEKPREATEIILGA